LQRTHAPESGVVLFVMPFGEKGGFDYDQFYEKELKPLLEDHGLRPERLDSLYGPQGILDLVWRSIQRAEMIVVDFSHGSVNVGMELAWAMLIGKRYVIIAQDDQDIPTDIRGLNRHLKYSENYRDVHHLKDELVAQLDALQREPVEEMALIPFMGYGASKVAAEVVAVEREYATVKTVDGRVGLITGKEVTYGKTITDLRRRFKVGDHVQGAFSVDIKTQEPRYTLLVNEENPWPEITATRPVGTRFSGQVVNVDERSGAFVRVLGAVNGLVPRSSFPDGLPPVGSEADVTVVTVDIEGRRVVLGLTAPPKPATTAPSSLPQVGQRFDGQVVKVAPLVDGRGGYLLLDVPGYERSAMLLAKSMTPGLSTRFNSEDIAQGEKIAVEVISVDVTRAKVLLRDLGAPNDSQDLYTPDPEE
jgi:sRNA-binding carbon storage regulator CsrA